MRVYHPADVDRLRKERNPEAQPFVLPSDTGPESKAIAPRASSASMERFLEVQERLSEAIEKVSPTSEVRLAERLFLKIPEASRYSGLPQSHIRQLIGEGKLAALKTGAGWRIRRADLEKL